MSTGAVGEALARLAADQGHQVKMGSRRPVRLVNPAEAIGCFAGILDEAAAFGEVVVAAISLGAMGSLPRAASGDRIVIDTMKYYPERDGRVAALDARETTSERVAPQLSEARL